MEKEELIEHHKISIKKTAHFYTIGNFSKKTKFIWLACHGYGQSAERFIGKFAGLDLNKHFIIAPEGLSRFYWGGLDGYVVASWMTRKDRLDEIADQINFLHQTMSPYDQHPATFIYFGFSQGCATIFRYLERFLPKFKHIVLWAGSIPKDLNFQKMSSYLKEGKIHLIYGDQDEFLTPDVLTTELDFIEQNQIKIVEHRFQGSHRIDEKILQEFVETVL